MKILTRTNAIRRDDRQEQISQEQTSFEIPNTTIAGLGAILTLILTLASGISPLIKEWVVGIPNERVEIEIKEDEFELKMLKQALQTKTPHDRAASLKLLINTGILKDPKGELIKQANNPESLPSWDTQSIPATLPVPPPTAAQARPVPQPTSTPAN